MPGTPVGASEAREQEAGLCPHESLGREVTITQAKERERCKGLPDDPVVENLPCNGERGFNPDQGTKIPHAMEELCPVRNTLENLCTTTKVLGDTRKMPLFMTKT